jgi:small multidrug resistance pump
MRLMSGYYAALTAAIVLGGLGQLFLKSGAGRVATLTEQFQNPLTILGLGIYALAALLYIVAIKVIPVSVAFPSVSASYILVGLAAHFLWNEPFGVAQVAGYLLIGCGIFLAYR